MNKNVIVAVANHKLDGYCFTTKEDEDQNPLVFKEDISIGNRTISDFKMTFSVGFNTSGWTVWTPIDKELDNQSHDVLKVFFLGGKAEDGNHGTVKAIDLKDKVTAPSGQLYRICFRFRHWVFYEAIYSVLTH